MVLVAADRSAKQKQAPVSKAQIVENTNVFAKNITSGQTDGIIKPKAGNILNDLSDPPPPGPAGPIAIARPNSLDTPPVSPLGAGSGQLNKPPLEKPAGDDRVQERVVMAKLQLFEASVKAKTRVEFTPARSAGSSSALHGSTNTNSDVLARLAAVRQQIDSATRDDPTAAYKMRLQQLQTAGIAGGTGGGASAAPVLFKGPAAGSASKDLNLLANPDQENQWRLNSQPEAPRSPYELRAGFVIPALLISGINSDLPGQITAQVSQDVFDTATGKWRLIPQGSRLIGKYSSDILYGQSRVLVAWVRIIFPDGKAMDIGSMPGADSAGYAGFTDKVDNHYMRLFASAFLMSGVTAGVALSQPKTTAANGQQSTSSALSEALGQQLGQVTGQLIAKNMSISPTLQIRPGYRFNVTVTKDMTFTKPYKAFDY